VKRKRRKEEGRELGKSREDEGIITKRNYKVVRFFTLE
jgi:hypothetical protein